MLGHKANVGRFNKTEIKSSIYSWPQHYEIRNQLKGKKKKLKKKYKHTEAKQYATEQPKDHWRSKRGNEKITRDKWKRKYDDPNPMGHGNQSSERSL